MTIRHTLCVFTSSADDFSTDAGQTLMRHSIAERLGVAAAAERHRLSPVSCCDKCGLDMDDVCESVDDCRTGVCANEWGESVEDIEEMLRDVSAMGSIGSSSVSLILDGVRMCLDQLYP
nr:hypothetical protein Iba_chr11dCG0440 [Ipomoea batatas]